MITALYAGPLALLLIVLSARVITYRRANRIGLGDSGDNSLLKRMRAQANCAEYAPIGIVMMLLVELQNAPAPLVHLIGALLLVGRLMHAYGFSSSPPKMNLRVGGMVLTFISLALSALSAVSLALI